MRKIFVSTLVLSIFIGSTSDIFAQRKRASVITSRTGRAGNRGGSGTTSNSSSSSSSSNTDMLGTTKRFKDNTYNYSDKLYYDNEYNLNTFLTGATSDYYYNNGSSSINEQLCFGPYMFINKNTEDSNYLEYVGIEKSEATRTCIDIMPNMTYTLGLIPASDEAIQDASAEGRYLTIQNNNFPSRDIKKLLTTEKYVDVSEHATNIVNALKEVENNCSKYHENMDSIRKQLGTVLGTSIAGTALSAGATAVNVLNVKKTEETGKKIANKENAQKQNDEILSKYQSSCPDCKDKCSEEATKTDDGKKACIECVKRVMEEDYNNKVCDEGSKENFVKEYNAKRERIITLVIDKVKGWETSSRECEEKIEKGVFTNLLGDNNFICEDRENQTNIWRTSVLGSKTQLTENEEWCKNTWDDKHKDENGIHQCVKMYAEWHLNKSGTFPEKITIDDVDSTDSTNTVVKAKVDGYSEDQKLMDLKTKNCDTKGGQISTTNKDLSSTEIKAKINELDTYLSNVNIINDNKIAENMAASKKMDIANVWLSGASTLTSGVSVGFSIAAVAKVKEALENLEKCEKSLTELNSKFNEYNAEIEAEEGEY